MFQEERLQSWCISQMTIPACHPEDVYHPLVCCLIPNTYSLAQSLVSTLYPLCAVDIWDLEANSVLGDRGMINGKSQSLNR